MSGNCSTSESPYQNCLKQVKCASLSDSASDLDDFRTPTAIKKVSKIAKLPKNAKTKRKPSAKAPIRKFLEDNFKHSDVNGDHLQMALALSESSYEAENRNEGPSSQEKMDNFKKTLEKYGFGYGKKDGSGYKKDFYSIVASSANKPRNTRSRYRFVTPILKMRTSEERDALISSKVSLILAQNSRFPDYNIQKDPVKLYCESLQDYHRSKIFNINNMCLEELNRDLFYCKGLPVEACATPCGYLLKDWGQIPGRDISPARKNDQVSSSEEKSSSQSQSAIFSKNATPQRQSPVYVYDGSVSPDLFASDDESDRGQLSPLEANKGDLNQSDGQNQSKNTKDPMSSFQSNKSNTEDMEIVECYDLTQSSDEEDVRNLSKNQVGDMKIFEKKDMKNRSSEDKVALTQSEKRNVDESLKKTEKINVSENLRTPEHKSQSPERTDDTLVYSLFENDCQFQSPEPTNRFDSSENEHLSPQSKRKNPEGGYLPYQSPELSLKHCKSEKNRGKLLEIEILSTSSSEDSHKEDERRNSVEGTSSKFSEHHSPESDWQLELENEFESPEKEHLSSLSKCKDPEREYLPYQSPESNLKHCKTEKHSRRPPEISNFNPLSPDDSHTKVEKRSGEDISNKSFEQHSPEYDWQLDTLEYQVSGIESPELNVKGHNTDENFEVLPETESKNKDVIDENLTDGESQKKSDENHHQIPERIYSPEYEWQSDTLEYQFPEKIPFKAPENGYQSVTNENHESPDNNESMRKSPGKSEGFRDIESIQNNQYEAAERNHRSPEWQYHSPEYDWQSDAAAFQFSEASPESMKPNNKTFEPVSRSFECRHESPEPFADDWIPSVPFQASEQMECYNLSEDETECARNKEKISTSEDSKLSQESICISDDEVNYSSVFATPHPKKKTRKDVKDTEEEKLAPLEDSFNDVLAQSVVLKQLEPQSESARTPSTVNNDNFVIKTKNITPMANYDEMDTPKIVRELDKFGLKPLKRQRGAKLLKYIYESTHPLVEEGSDDDGTAAKKRRTGSLHFDGVVGDIDEDEWVFERTQSKRVPSCRIPLHIVWHNFVRSNPKIQENILLYEPLQLEILHSMLKEQGFKFNIQDLLTFLDKKCVTIRTAQGQRHGKKTRP